MSGQGDYMHNEGIMFPVPQGAGNIEKGVSNDVFTHTGNPTKSLMRKQRSVSS